MTEASESRINCPSCGKRYRWKRELAGRKVACKCGQKMRLPKEPTGQARSIDPPPAADPGDASTSPDASTYDLKVPDPDAPGPDEASSGGAFIDEHPNKCPACNQPMNPEAVICVQCGYNVQAGQKLEIEVGETTEDADAGSHPALEDAQRLADHPIAQSAMKQSGKKEDPAADSQWKKVVLALVLLCIAAALIIYYTLD